MTSSPTPASPPDFHFKASRQPMLWASVAYSLGVVAGVYQWRPALWWVVAGAAFVGAAAYFAGRRSSLGWLLALGALFVAGALHIQARSASARLDTAIQPYADRQELQLIAHVTRDGRVQPGGPHEIRQTIDVETEELQTADGQTEPIHSGVRLSIYSPSSDAHEVNASPIASIPLFRYGDRIRLSGKLRAPRNFAIQAPLIIGAILPIEISRPWARPAWKMSNGFPDLPATASRLGVADSTGGLSRKCINSGPRTTPP